jgi:hypothetical protein
MNEWAHWYTKAKRQLRPAEWDDFKFFVGNGPDDQRCERAKEFLSFRPFERISVEVNVSPGVDMEQIAKRVANVIRKRQ